MNDRTPTEEILLARVTDRADGPADWAELERLSEADPDLWRRLGATLHQESLLRTAGVELAGVAERVAALPLRRSVPARTWRRVAAAAALLLAAFVAGRLWGRPLPEPSVEPARSLLAEGPLGPEGSQLPPLVVSTRPAPDGQGVEVLYLRSVIEREVVPALFEVGRDDAARPVPQPLPTPGMAQLTFL